MSLTQEISTLKHEANIANSEKSTGPRTPEGKRRSSLNARRHQLTAKVYIAPAGEMDSYDAHCKSLREAHKPVGILESETCAELSSLKWRIKRIEAVENAIFAQGHKDHIPSMDSGDEQVDAALAEGQTWIEHAHSLTLLTTYEQRLRRAAEKAAAELEKLQAARKLAYGKAQAEAIDLLKAALAAGGTYNPGGDFEPASEHGGFVYDESALTRQIDRARRIDAAFWPARNVDRAA